MSAAVCAVCGHVQGRHLRDGCCVVLASPAGANFCPCPAYRQEPAAVSEECRHESMHGDNTDPRAVQTWTCDHCGHWVYAQPDRSLAAEVARLREVLATLEATTAARVEQTERLLAEVARLREDNARLRTAVQSVLALHRRRDWQEIDDDSGMPHEPGTGHDLPPFCEECTDDEYVSECEDGDLDLAAPVVSWPCSTVEILRAALTVTAPTDPTEEAPDA